VNTHPIGSQKSKGPKNPSLQLGYLEDVLSPGNHEPITSTLPEAASTFLRAALLA
jgi:hypothetical protein